MRVPLVAGCLIASALCAVTQAATFTGTVFEDANYGGGAGRSLAASGGTVLAGVTVELYRASNGNFVASTTTDINGFYSLSNGTNNYQVRVRVVNGTVRSARTGGAACTTCVPVQTFRTEGSGNGIVPVTDRVGGETPAASDAYVYQGSGGFGGLTSGGRVPQSYATVTPAANGSTIAGIDFGFNFDTVVNTRDATVCDADQFELSLPGLAAPVRDQRQCAGRRGAPRAIRQRPDRRRHHQPAAGIRIQHLHDPERCAHRGCRRDHARRRIDQRDGREHAAGCHYPDRQHRQHQRRYAGHGRHGGRRRRQPAYVSSGPKCSSRPATPSITLARQQQRRARLRVAPGLYPDRPAPAAWRATTWSA